MLNRELSSIAYGIWLWEMEPGHSWFHLPENILVWPGHGHPENRKVERGGPLNMVSSYLFLPV